MNEKFTHLKPEELQDNFFDAVGNQWMLISAGDEKASNMMTASWGTVGVLWGRPVAIVFIRPQRYTKEFVDSSDTFACSFFDEAYRPALSFCGSKSGRDYDKAKETGLTPVYDIPGAVYYDEAKRVLICKKLYVGQLHEDGFLLPEIIEHYYPEKDYHSVYVGEIMDVLSK